MSIKNVTSLKAPSSHSIVEEVNSGDDSSQTISSVVKKALAKDNTTQPKSLKHRTLTWFKDAGSWLKNQFQKILNIFRKKQNLEPIIQLPHNCNSEKTELSHSKAPRETENSLTAKKNLSRVPSVIRTPVVEEPKKSTESIPEVSTPGNPEELAALAELKKHALDLVKDVDLLVKDRDFDSWDKVENFFSKAIDVWNTQKTCELYLGDLTGDLKQEFEEVSASLQSTQSNLNAVLENADIKKDLAAQIQIKSQDLQAKQKAINDLKATIRKLQADEESTENFSVVLKSDEADLHQQLAAFFNLLVTPNLFSREIKIQKEKLLVLESNFTPNDFTSETSVRSFGGLTNLTNSCYINSTLQLLKAQGLLAKMTAKISSITYEEDPLRFQLVESMKEIVALLDEEKTSETEDLTAITERLNAALYSLRFASILYHHGGDFQLEQLTRQEDGAQFIMHLLTNLNFSLPFHTITHSGAGDSSSESNDSQIRLNFDYSGGTEAAKTQNLQNLINLFFEENKIEGSHSDITTKMVLANAPKFIPISLLRFARPNLPRVEQIEKYLEFQALMQSCAEDISKADIVNYKKRHPKRSDEKVLATLKKRRVRQLVEQERKVFFNLSEDKQSTLLLEQNNNYSGFKIKTPVTLPDNGLIAVKCHFGEMDYDYEVVGFQVHVGDEVNNGHYIAYRLDEDNVWREYNDEKVTVMDDETIKIKKSEAYNLLLKRVGPRSVLI